MIAIADSGSTKTDWAILNDDLTENFRTSTIGFNPYHIKADAIETEMLKNKEILAVADKIKAVYFYGSGCSADFLKNIIKEGFKNIFKNADITVEHDLLAACYSAYRGKPCMVCILGTGSNACYFDGEKLIDTIPSMAYILGDEGSGSYMGKKVIHAYFSNKMPKELAEKFYEKYKLTIEELNVNVYQRPLANVYLASFSKFVYENKEDRFIQNLIFTSMKGFYENQVLPNLKPEAVEVNFIGSVAHYYEDFIRAAAPLFHLEVGHIVRKPIDNLIDYHLKYILNK